MEQLLTLSAIWAIAVVLYYFAGKKHGYADGYSDGIRQGHQNVLSVFQASSDFLTDTKP